MPVRKAPGRPAGQRFGRAVLCRRSRRPQMPSQKAGSDGDALRAAAYCRNFSLAFGHQFLESAKDPGFSSLRANPTPELEAALEIGRDPRGAGRDLRGGGPWTFRSPGRCGGQLADRHARFCPRSIRPAAAAASGGDSWRARSLAIFLPGHYNISAFSAKGGRAARGSLGSRSPQNLRTGASGTALRAKV